eukprot:gene31248-6393_t
MLSYISTQVVLNANTWLSDIEHAVSTATLLSGTSHANQHAVSKPTPAVYKSPRGGLMPNTLVLNITNAVSNNSNTASGHQHHAVSNANTCLSDDQQRRGV